MKPRWLIVAGPNGAGKSTLTARLEKRFADRLGQLLDADAIARALNPNKPGKAAILVVLAGLTLELRVQPPRAAIRLDFEGGVNRPDPSTPTQGCDKEVD